MNRAAVDNNLIGRKNDEFKRKFDVQVKNVHLKYIQYKIDRIQCDISPLKSLRKMVRRRGKMLSHCGIMLDCTGKMLPITKYLQIHVHS